MKTQLNVRKPHVKLSAFGKIILLSTLIVGITIGCSKDELIEPIEPAPEFTQLKATVSITNPGFENKFSGWSDIDPSAISSSAHSGSRSGKITGSGGSFSQDVNVSSNTNYKLSAWVKGDWRFGVRVNGNKKTRSGSTSSWKKETVTFSSGSSTTVTILAQYKGSKDGRYDDFTLETDGSSGGGGGEGTPGYFDLGTGSSPVFTGYNRVTQQTTSGNYRWTNSSGLYSADRGSAQNNLNRDFVYSSQPRTFEYTTANGTYDVVVTLGDNNYAHDNMVIKAEGITVKSNIDRNIGQITNETFQTTVSDGKLSLEFSDAGGNDRNWVVNRIKIDRNSGGGGGGSNGYPSSVLDLSLWELTLPIPQSSNEPDNPKDVYQPALNTYKHSTYFHLNSAGNGVVFRAHAGGTTTSGSSYPRSELREMKAGYSSSSQKASWSTTSGTHTMFIRQAITHLPDVKKHIVAGQIHDKNDDVIVFRLENKKLFIDINGNDGPVLTSNYNLGTEFTCKFVAGGGKIKCYYNNSLKYTYSKSTSGCYFKAGAYTQSNTSKGDSYNAYGEVVIYDLQVSHN